MGRPRHSSPAHRPPQRPRPSPAAPIGWIEAVWIAALATIPSAVNPFALARYDSEKALLLRGWAAMAALGLAAHALAAWRRGGRSALQRISALGLTPLLAALAAWLLVSAVAGGLALSPALAWWGGANRGDGVLTTLALGVLLAGLATTCRSPRQIERLLLAVVLGSVLPTLVGWLQVAGVPLFRGRGGFPEGRPWSTFGNSIAYGSYLAGVLPATAYAVLREPWRRRAVPAALLAAQVLMLLHTASRGPLLGLLAAAAVGALLWLRRHRRHDAATAGAVGVVVLLAVFLGGVQLIARSDVVRRHTRTGMLTRYNTVEVRVLLYQALTARAFDRRPIARPDGVSDPRARWRPWIGYGPACLAEPLLSRLPPRFEAVEGENRIPDSTHSVTMDILGGTGLLGLAAHLLWVAAALHVASRALRLGRPAARRWPVPLLFGAATCLGAAGMVRLWGAFGWALGLMAGLYVGVLLFLAWESFSERRRTPGAPATSAPLAALCLSTSALALWIEAQFGIPLVASGLLLAFAVGLLAALAARPPGRGPPAAAAEERATDLAGPWTAVALLASALALLGSALHNPADLADPWSLLREAWSGQGLWAVFAVWAFATWWWARPGSRLRTLAGSAAPLLLLLALHADGLAGIRTGTLRSVDELAAWAGRRQQLAALRWLPPALLPALLAVRRWRHAVPALLATAAGLAAANALGPGWRADIALATAFQIRDHGEPRAAVETFRRSAGTLRRAHEAHYASQLRRLAARAARQDLEREAVEPPAAWRTAIETAQRAVTARPLLASHHVELGGVLESVARALPAGHPTRRGWSRAAEAAYANGVALAPGLHAYGHRLAHLRYSLLDDPGAAFGELERMLEEDPVNAVALSMLARRAHLAGQAAALPERAGHYAQALEFAERCLASPGAGRQRVNRSAVRAQRDDLRRWFRDQGLAVPRWQPPPSPPAAARIPPRLPAPDELPMLLGLLKRAAAAIAAALFLTPVLRRIAPRVGFVDQPEARKLHHTPVPLLGGVAILVATLLGGLFPWDRWVDIPAPLPALLGAATALALVGLLDDRRPLPWAVKLAAQLLAAIALQRAGVRVELAWLPDWANLLLTLGWLVGITNAVNFLDNMNGLSAGLCALAAAVIALLGLLNEGWAVAAVAMAVLGACAGFLRYNHHWHATIFMGDAGSLFLGLMLAGLALELRFPANHNWVTWLCPVLLLAVPVFDMTHVCLARIRRGQNPFSTPGKDHTSHLLARMGFKPQGAVLAIHGAALGCGIAAGVVAYSSTLVAYGIAGAFAAAGAALLLYFELRFGRGGSDA